jgi:mono/diheme cytochrome c family protein
VGCHEQRTRTPENREENALLALRRPPSRIRAFEGYPDVLDYHRDVQPILDRHCVRCHGHERREGGALLTGDLGPVWSHGYFSLLAHNQVADGRNGLGNQPPRTLGSSASPLLSKVKGSHHDVQVRPQEWRTLWLWIESGAPYAGTYAALRNADEQALAGRATAAVARGIGDTLGRRCFSCHAPGSPKAIPFNWERRKQEKPRIGRPTAAHERVIFENDPIARYSYHILINFTHPDCSPLLLAPLAPEAGGYGRCGEVFRDRSDTDYMRILRAIEAGKAVSDSEPRFATPGFKPNRQYVRELKRFGVLPESFDISRDEIDIFEADQRYWQSLWLEAPGETATSTAAGGDVRL